MSGMRVLIADDVSRVRQDLCSLLSLFAGIDIVGEAADGLQAIQKAADLQPQVILMDLEMPNLDGYQATQRIKARFPACRIIALSVHGYEEARQRAFRAGVDAFIVKGAPVESLLEAILKERE